MRSTAVLSVIASLGFLVVAGCGGASPSVSALPAAMPAAAQPAVNPEHPNWAQHQYEPGLGNFAKVSDNVYRGAKPTGEGFRQLKAMGVKTVVDLGWWFFEIDNLRDPVLSYVRIPFYTYNAKDADVVRFLQLATDKKDGPIFVHCRKGADRTGFMIAVYRVVVSGWSREEAIAEMTRGGFGFDPTYQNLVDYVRNRDLAALARQAGIEPAPAVAQAPAATPDVR